MPASPRPHARAAVAAGLLLLVPALTHAAPALPAGPAASASAGWPRIPFLGKKKKAPADSSKPSAVAAKPAPKGKAATAAPAKGTPAKGTKPQPTKAPVAAPAPAPAAAPRTAEDTVRAMDAAAEREARRGFTDSWFWGVKGGLLRFGTLTEGMVSAPSIGADWMITRSKGALLVGFDQALFDRTSAVPAQIGTDSILRVSMKNARRFSATALATPKAFGRLRPYAGAGLVLELIDGAVPQRSTAGPGQRDPNQGFVDDAASRVAFQLVGGAQYQVGRAAAFVQGSVTPAQTRSSLWNYGKPGLFEVGVRFNFGDAVDRF